MSSTLPSDFQICARSWLQFCGLSSAGLKCSNARINTPTHWFPWELDSLLESSLSKKVFPSYVFGGNRFFYVVWLFIYQRETYLRQADHTSRIGVEFITPVGASPGIRVDCWEFSNPQGSSGQLFMNFFDMYRKLQLVLHKKGAQAWYHKNSPKWKHICEQLECGNAVRNAIPIKTQGDSDQAVPACAEAQIEAGGRMVVLFS